MEIYVALTVMVNPHYIKTRGMNKEKGNLTKLTDFALSKSLSESV